MLVNNYARRGFDPAMWYLKLEDMATKKYVTMMLLLMLMIQMMVS